MSQSSFDFSPNAVKRFHASKSTNATTSTPDFLDIITPPTLSPIDFSNSFNRKEDSSNSSNSGNSADLECSRKNDLKVENVCNTSNINNRHFNVSTILDDLGMGQYKTLFEMEEIDLMIFFMLTDEDLQELGVKDELHREIFKNAIRKYCGLPG